MPPVGPAHRPSGLGDWVQHGACQPDQAALFFPDHHQLGGQLTRAEYERRAAAVWAPARAICNRCPVRQDCLDHAIEHREEHGMWGGHTPRERDALR